MEASPNKRRVLGALDVNTTTSPARALTPSKRDALKPHSLISASSTRVPSSAHVTTPKRPLEAEQEGTPRKRIEDQQPPSKKLCLTPPTTTVVGDDQSRDMDDDDDDVSSLEEQTSQEQDLDEEQDEEQKRERQRSDSPADSSIFDNSAHDISQSTIMTEPDTEVAAPPAVALVAPLPPPPPPAPPQRPAMTREEARQKAEILRLRLGLASYKVRTGQTEVPLERLQQFRRSSLVSGGRSFPAPFTTSTTTTTNGYNSNSVNTTATSTYGSRSFGGYATNMNGNMAPQHTSPNRQSREHRQQQHSRQLPPLLPPPSTSTSRRLLPPPPSSSTSSFPLPRPRPLPLPSPWREDDANDEDKENENEEQQPELPPQSGRRQTSAPPPQRKALPSLQPRGASFSHAPRDAALSATAPAVAARDLLSLSRA